MPSVWVYQNYIDSSSYTVDEVQHGLGKVDRSKSSS